MGTRVDFYIGRGEQAEWLGSAAYDGYPDGIDLTGATKDKYGFSGHSDFPAGRHLFDATTEEEFKERLLQYFERREDVTLPEQGWPWPWDDSQTTDYAYAFDNGKVYASCFGHRWFDPLDPLKDEDDGGKKVAIFPNMKSRANIAWGQRSGLMILQV